MCWGHVRDMYGTNNSYVRDNGGLWKNVKHVHDVSDPPFLSS